MRFFQGFKDKYEHIRDDADSGDFATEANAYYISPWLFHVNITELPPCSSFTYRVGIQGDTDIFSSEEYYFHTPPLVGETCVRHKYLRKVNEPESEEMRVAVVGDIGQTDFSKNTRDYLIELSEDNHYPCLLLVGDIAYADGDLNRWDSWGRLFEPLTAFLPLMTLPGNHEFEIASDGESFVSYRKRFFMPEVQKEKTKIAQGVSKENVDEYKVSLDYEYGSSFYSFNMGKIHFVMLNTYNTHSYFDGSENVQESWLRSDLERIDRKITPFIVVCGHAPIFSTSKVHQGEFASEKTAEWVEPLLNEFSVELYLSGHVHAYERIRMQHLTTHITIGDGGNHELLYGNWTKSEISAYRDARYYGHGEVIVFNKTHMKWLFKPNPTQEGTEIDEVIIISNFYRNQLQFEESILELNQYGVVLALMFGIIYILYCYPTQKKHSFSSVSLKEND